MNLKKIINVALIFMIIQILLLRSEVDKFGDLISNLQKFKFKLTNIYNDKYFF